MSGLSKQGELNVDVMDHSIIESGGFDVIIGNPPYLDLKGFNDYTLDGFSTLNTKNLYPLVLERCGALSGHSRQGFIVPVSSVATEGYLSLQRFLVSRNLIISSFDDRPSHLFDGLDKNTLSILLIAPKLSERNRTCTRLNRWNANERTTLFNRLQYAPMPRCILPGCWPKLSSATELNIWEKMFHETRRLVDCYAAHGKHIVYYSRKVNAFMQVLDFIPEVRDGKGNRRPPSEFQALAFSNDDEAAAAYCVLNSTLFRWFMDVVSDGSHLNRREIDNFPFDTQLAVSRSPNFSTLAKQLSQQFKQTSEVRVMRYEHDTLTVQCIIGKHAKPVIDNIEAAIARHYGLEHEELDFLINYDIKYRVPSNNAGEN